FALALFVLVQKFPVVHDAANRSLRGRGNFHQVEISFAGHFERLEGRHHANLARPDALVHAYKTLVDTVLRLLIWQERCLKSIARGRCEPTPRPSAPAEAAEIAPWPAVTPPPLSQSATAGTAAYSRPPSAAP